MEYNIRTSIYYVKYKFIILLICTPLFIFSSSYNGKIIFLLITDLFFLSYNYICYYVITKKPKKYNLVKFTMPYADIAFCTMVVISRGGLRSDSFAFFLIIINIYGVLNSKSITYLVCFLSMIAYGLACILFTSPQFYSTGRLIIRLTYFPLFTLTNIFVKNQVNLLTKDLLRERQRARRDQLTKLWNRVMLKDIVSYEIENTTDMDKKYGIILIDIDKFKNFNDTFGHVVGDKVLIMVGEALRKHVFNPDYSFRVGGDEFLVLAMECNDMKLSWYEKIIKEDIEKMQVFHDGIKLKITVSMGKEMFGKNEFLKAMETADKRMYEEKNSIEL